jgi:hypothetical protein
VRVDPVEPPRTFEVGEGGARLAHVADLELEADEVVTFKTASGTEFDVTRKAWGYYGTPSFNGRLQEHGLRAALALGMPRVTESSERMYLMLVEAGREPEFEAYMSAEGMRVLAWLDDDQRVADAASRLGT